MSLKKKKKKAFNILNHKVTHYLSYFARLRKRRKSWGKLSTRCFKTRLKTYDIQVVLNVTTIVRFHQGSVNPVTAIIRFYGSRHIAGAQYGAINFSFVPM